MCSSPIRHNNFHEDYLYLLVHTVLLIASPLFLSGSHVSGSNEILSMTSTRFNNKALVNHISVTEPVSSLNQCFKLCLDCINRVRSDCQCLSFNLKRESSTGSMQCEVNNQRSESYPQDFIEKQGFQFYEIN